MAFDPDQIKKFPTQPGVYLMKDRKGKVLYIGKAKNLRSRVRQYFGASGDDRPMIPLLVPKVEAVETIVTASEKEALLLENTLIKQHQPRYNALLKDDKSYVSLKITKHRWPMIQLVRYKGKPKDDGKYFGPYTSAFAAKQTLELINRAFPLRRCSDRELASRKRPCILHAIGKCSAPCVDLVTKEQYDHYVAQTVKFLEGKDKEVLRQLHKEMQQASDALEFEEAGRILKAIRQIEATIEKQKVFKAQGADRDVIGLHRSGPDVVVTRMFYREGRLVGSRNHLFNKNAEEDESLLTSLLLQAYAEKANQPHEILLPVGLPDQEVVEELLQPKSGHRVHLLTPQRGEKKAQVELANTNAKATFKRERDEEAALERSLITMQERFRLQNYPRRIECIDTSNTAGTEPVGAIVAFTDGKKDSSRYRKYKVRSTEVPDDYGAMNEILTRRFARGKQERNLPDLLIVDGGKGQLNIALRVLQELDITSVDVIGLAKEEARHDKGLTAEKVYIPKWRDPIPLPKSSPILFLLQAIRDETHRVAIGFHRQRRQKRIVSSALETIPGIGPVKKQRLLKKFGSLKRLKEASNEDILETDGISKKDLDSLRSFFNSKDQE